ncbi:MAG: ComEC/Rec2 family competence protein, partial [Bacteroidales bacterium]|nr:ComEC/Rec2 family competence protein [Bacteroidales bacterium]
MVISTTLLIVIQFIRTRRRSYINGIHLATFILVFFLLGYLRHQQVYTTNNFDGPIKSDFSATVLSPPTLKTKSYRVDLMLDSAFSDSSSYAISTKVISYIQKSPEVLDLIPGQRIRFHSLLNPPTGIMNPEDFDYKAYLQRKSIFATTYIPSEAWQLRSDEHLTITIIAARIQNYVLEVLKELNYEKEEMALLSALTIGYKQMISDDQRQAYIASGSTHVLAVSGLHVGIIFLFLTRIFKVFGKRRKIVIIRLLIIISLLWCFAFITGLSPSVTRATLMFSLVSIGTAGRQRSSIFNTLFLSAIILLLIDPHLVFDIGFQLSYCAVLGIIAFHPYLSKFFIEKLHIPKFFADLIAISIAAQLGTAPISIHAFNCFPNYFILTNIWVIPLVGVIVNLAIVLIIVALIGWPTTWIAWPLAYLLKGMNMGVELISQIPHSLTTCLYVDAPTMILLYTAIIMLVFALDYHSKHYLFTV